MKTTQERIEFYKPRDFSGRLSVTFQFIRSNFSLFLKNMALLVVPIALIQAYFMKDYLNMDFFQTTDYLWIFKNLGIGVLLFYLASILIYSLTASMMTAYGEGKLEKGTGIKDLKHFGGYFAITALVVFCLLLTFGLICFIFASISPVLLVLIFIGSFVLFPSLSLVLFPAYYEGLGPWDSFNKGFRMGFKNWGTTFLMLLILGIMIGVIQYVMFIPYYIWIVVKLLLFPDITHWYDSLISYITTLIVYLGSYLTMPVLVIGLSFQYFGIREQEEQVSLQSEIDNFEDL